MPKEVTAVFYTICCFIFWGVGGGVVIWKQESLNFLSLCQTFYQI
jgi:hypothetical protein